MIDAVGAGRPLLPAVALLVVVLDGGRVVACRTHAELIESSPLYRELASAQLLV